MDESGLGDEIFRYANYVHKLQQDYWALLTKIQYMNKFKKKSLQAN